MSTIMEDAATLLKKIRLGPELMSRMHVRESMINALRDIQPSDNELDHKTRRAQVHELAIQVAKLGIFRAEHMRDDFSSWAMAISPLLNWDIAVLTKLVIHFQLFGGTVVELGTDRHQKWVDMINNGQVIGGFAMTEIGHGSNVQAIETRADYDESTAEFVLSSPTPSSTKFMIGNVGVHGEVVVLMAQLYLKGVRKGVHAFIVPLRVQGSGDVLPGVEVGDIGLKSSWNEVDNAWIRFNGMRIPRENLLNKFAEVTPAGDYELKISLADKTNEAKVRGRLFAATMAQLLVGRINYVGAPIFAVATALSVALRYARQRVQFGSPEKPIISYSTHYSMLMEVSAKLVAFQLIRNNIIRRLPAVKSSIDSESKEVALYHAQLSGLKAYVCEWSYVILGQLRVMCGGAGIMHSNLIGMLHNYFDVFQTAEGDRTVLYQQLGKKLLSDAHARFSGATGMLRFAGSILSQQMIVLNPLLAMVEANEEDNIAQPGFLIHALSLRHEIAMRTLIARMQNLTTASKNAQTPAEAWNTALPYTIHACDCYLEYIIFEELNDQLNQFKTYYAAEKQRRGENFQPPRNGVGVPTLDLDLVSGCLTTVASVVGLSFLKKDAAFFATERVFSTLRTKTVENAFFAKTKVLYEKYADLLLESHEIVDEFVKAPLGQRDGNYVAHILATVKPAAKL